MSTIRKDIRGLYVKVGGYIFRPQVSRESYFRNPLARSIQTQYQEGDKVKARHVPCSCLAAVGEETWYGHGNYLGPGSEGQKSKDIWDPIQNTVSC